MSTHNGWVRVSSGVGSDEQKGYPGEKKVGKDYLLFLHGVNVRELPDSPDDLNFPKYANHLFELIRDILNREATPYDVEKIALYYGDLNMHEEESLLTLFQSSPQWERFWFRHARETILLQIIGDLALYVNPQVAARIVERVHQAVLKLQRWEQEHEERGRLHLVSHSLGTIILFDALFASRWEDEDMPGYNYIKELRDAVCGAGTKPEEGIQVASIHTMGSPIPLFSLLDMYSRQQENEEGQHENSHEIGPKLQVFLKHLAQNRGGKRLPWWNYAHPGDPLAYPLEGLLYQLVDQKRDYLEVHDVVTWAGDIGDWMIESFKQSSAALIHAGAAHRSYWNSEIIARRIAKTIQETSLASMESEMDYVGGGDPS